MNFFGLVFSALVAITSAGYHDNSVSSPNSVHQGKEYVPVITPQGVPEDTPEVKAAKAEHFALFAKAQALAESAKTNQRDRKVQHWKETSKSYYSSPVIKENGYGWTYSPQDTAEVAAAKAAHLQALHKAQSLELSNYGQLDDGKWRGEEYYTINRKNNNNGVYSSNQYLYSFPGSHEPVAPVVQQAELAQFNTLGHVQQTPHFNYHHQQLQHHHRYRRGIFSHTPIYLNHFSNEHVPVISKDGVPLDTPEVQHARQQHLLAHAQAKNYASHVYSNNHNTYNNNGIQGSSVNYKISHDISYQKYNGPQYIPLIENGVPVDTPEVQLARDQHLFAFNKAKQGVIVGPVDTPEVQLAKRQHLLAHAQEKTKHHGGFPRQENFQFSNHIHH